jgi:NitT/TauT family transport system substrate-binding protein
MKRKITLLLLLLFLFSGCTAKIEDTKLSILVPMGAPSIAVIPVLKEDIHSVNLVSGTDPLQAALISPNPEYDIIIAPVNLGASLISKNSSQYRLWGVVTWGNLYIVGENEDVLSSEGTLALFGENAVPQKIFDSVQSSMNLMLTPAYFPSVNDAQAQLLTQKVSAAMLAQPLAAATIAKAKEGGRELKIIANLQTLWKESTGAENYPQAAIFVLESSYKNSKTVIEKQISAMKDYVDACWGESSTLEADITALTPEKLGLPSAKLVATVFKGMNVKIEAALDVEEELIVFLRLFGLTNIRELIIN